MTVPLFQYPVMRPSTALEPHVSDTYGPIPRFSPEEGKRYDIENILLPNSQQPIIESLPGLFFTTGITEDMYDGNRLALADFRAASDSLGFHIANGAYAFSYPYRQLYASGRAAYFENHAMRSDRHDPFGHYEYLASSPETRGLVMMSTQAILEFYFSFDESYRNAGHKFLRIIETLFEFDELRSFENDVPQKTHNETVDN